MKHNDAKTREEIRQAMQTALQQDDKEGFAAAMNDMMACIGEDIKQDYEGKIEQLRQENDSRALTSRGVRQLTSQEKQYYQKLGEAMRAADPKQALANLDVVMPETVIDSVFDDLRGASSAVPYRISVHRRCNQDADEHQRTAGGAVGRTDGYDCEGAAFRLQGSQCNPAEAVRFPACLQGNAGLGSRMAG